MLIDLSHPFTSTMPVFPGDPVASIAQTAKLERNGFVDHQISSGMHVGTHIDAPLHMIAGGTMLSEIPLERFRGPGIIVDARGKPEIDASLLQGKKLLPGSVVLILTGHDMLYGKDTYFTSSPMVSVSFAEALVKARVSMVGMDIPGPDRPPFPIHRLLLGGNVLIIENLTNVQSLLTASRFEVMAFPVKYETDGAPVRVVAQYRT